jgi:hypothetical protein
LESNSNLTRPDGVWLGQAGSSFFSFLLGVPKEGEFSEKKVGEAIQLHFFLPFLSSFFLCDENLGPIQKNKQCC